MNVFRVLCLVALMVCTVQADVITDVQQLPTTPTLPALYQTNRAPLQPVPLMKLPPGAITPEGWLRQQLLLDANGLPGRMEQISDYLTPDNGWVNTNYANGWEEVPYWLRGYEELGYVLKDQTIIDDAVTNWLQKIMATQVISGPNAGVFGPSPIYTAPSNSIDIWPLMPACEALQHYYDYSGNPAVIIFMTNYFNWVNRHQYVIGPGWANPRWGDHLETIYWLYNITGQTFLLNLATNIQNICGGQWLNGTYSWHNVNFAQGFREPAEYWMQSDNAPDLAATENDYDQIMDRFGGYPGGGFSGDEVCRPGYDDPRQGFETCGHVEFMKSFEILTRITGNPVLADRCEEIAFNRLPTVTPPDHSGVCYLSSANAIEIVNEPQLHHQFDDSPTPLFAYMPGTHQYRCCPHNYAMGWPYYAESLWLATADHGLCASLYAASQVQAKVADGSTVSIAEATDYPFSDTVNLTVLLTNSQPLNFPLYLRVPDWCATNAASLQINGTPVAVSATPLSYIEIQRAWSNGDTVTYQMPMQLGVTTWATNKNAVSINYGPLDFGLDIQEDWSKLPVSDPNSTDFNNTWPGYQVLPGSAWNYGLVLDSTNLTNGIAITRYTGALPANPFVWTNQTISLTVPARQIPNWSADVDGYVGQLQPSPVISTQTLQDVTLIPMGAARLRITTFPTMWTGTNAHKWKPLPLFWPTPSASYCNPGDTVNALCDGIEPDSSSDTSIQRFTWYGHRGTTEWVEYDYPEPVNISSSSVYWYDDGGGVQLPVLWELLCQDAMGNWVPVSNPSGYGTQLNTYNTTTFSPVTTRALRLQAVLSPNHAAGILEWRVPIDSAVVATGGDGQILLNWKSVPGATNYIVKRSMSLDGTYTAITNLAAMITPSYTDTGLTNGTTYYYEILAITMLGKGPASIPVRATPSIAGALQTWFKADAITGLSNRSLVTAWSNSSGNGYKPSNENQPLVQQPASLAYLVGITLLFIATCVVSASPVPVVWFKADSLAGLANGTEVAIWPDSSGNGDNAMQPVSYRQPSYVTNAMNGLPAVQFNAANSTYLSFTRPVSNDFTIIIVYESGQGIGTGVNFWEGAGLVNGEMPGAQNDFGMCLNANGQIIGGTGNPDTSIHSAYGFNDRRPHVVTFERTQSTGALSLFVDGSLVATGTGGTQSLTAPPQLVIGAQQPLNNYLNGDITEVQIYNTALSDADRAARENELKCKYGLSGGEVPASPSGLIAVPGNHQILLTWLPTAGADGYDLWRSTNDGGTYQLIAQGLSSPSYVDMNAVIGRTNWYEVASMDGCGASTNSVAKGAFLPLSALGFNESGNTLNITRPGWANDWVLYSATNLLPPVAWQPMTNLVATNNGAFNVNMSIGLGEQFFRLVSQQ